jgi:2-keto-4-pentenoate hydratase
MEKNYRVVALAARLIAARQQDSMTEIAASDAPRDANEAYAVQDFTLQELWTSQGDIIAAWKTGGPSPDVTPTAAPIPRSRVYRSPADIPASGFNFIGLEAELAYVLARDLPPRKQPYTQADLAEAVAAIVVAVEICDSRLRDWKTANPLIKLADFQVNGGLVVGSGARDWRRVVPQEQRARLYIDGRLVADNVGVHPYGDPIRLLPWLANHCADRCGGLRAGDVITTGTWTGLEFVNAGSEVRAEFPGVGEARMRFD